MPTLTIDLPETAYRAALAFAPDVRVRVAAAAFTAAHEAAPPPSTSIPPKTIAPETVARLRSQAAKQAIAVQAIYAQWANEETDLEAEAKMFEEHMANMNANRVATGERPVY